MPVRYLAFYDQSDPLAFPGSPVEYPIRLPNDNSFTGLEPTPQFADIRGHETENRVHDIVSTRYVLRGRLSTLLYPTQADWLLDWVLNAEPKASQFFDGVTYRQLLGIYVEQLTLSCAAEQDEGLVKAELDLVGIKPGGTITIAEFPEIDAADYPNTSPYKLKENKGRLIIVDSGSTARTKYSDLTLTIKNMLSPNWDEDEYVSDITYHGRDITLDANVRYVSGADRTLFEDKTPIIASVEFQKVLAGGSPNTHTLDLDLLTNNLYTGLDKQLPLAKPGYHKLMLRSRVNSTGNDITKTVTFV